MTQKQLLKLQRFIEAGAYVYISADLRDRKTIDFAVREIVQVKPGLLLVFPVETMNQHDVKVVEYDEAVDPHDLAVKFMDEFDDVVLYVTTLQEAGLELDAMETIIARLKTFKAQEEAKSQAWRDWVDFRNGQIQQFRGGA